MSDTPMTDALHAELVKISEGPHWIAGKDYCEMRQHAEALERQLSEARAELEEMRDTLRFVERWANHHGQKDCISPQEALSCIQHYPPIIAITRSYADGKVPETRNPWAELAEAREKALEEAAIAIESADKTKWVVASRDVVAAEIRALKDKP